MQILVFGTQRSGSSLVTRLINMMGPYFSSTNTSIGFDSEKQKGFWERQDIVACNDAILKHFGCEWDRLASWSMLSKKPKSKAKALVEADEEIKNIVAELDRNDSWVTKDPRLCLTFPLWKPSLEKPVAVVISRDPLETAMSIKTRQETSLAYGLAVWEYYTIGILGSLRDIPYIHLTHQELVSDPVASVKKLFEKLTDLGTEGLKMPEKEDIHAFVEPNLHRSKANISDHQAFLTPFQSDLHAMITGEKDLPEETLTPSKAAQDAMDHHARLKDRDIQRMDVNKKYAAAEQQRNELHTELQFAKRQLETQQEEIRKLTVSLEETSRQLQNTSDTGSRIARFFKRLTLQKV